MRIIGLDIHRVFAEAVALEDGKLKRLGRIGMTRGHVEAFAKTLARGTISWWRRPATQQR
jgi:transposase